MPDNTFEQRWDEACSDLSRTDRVMARLIAQYPGERLEPHGDLLRTLARAIVGQQISVMAAEHIWNRVKERAGMPSAKAFLAIGKQALLDCGLTRRKADYLAALADSSGGSHQIATDAPVSDGRALRAELLAL